MLTGATDVHPVILNGAKRSEESHAYEQLRFFAEPVLERSEGLRMTIEIDSSTSSE